MNDVCSPEDTASAAASFTCVWFSGPPTSGTPNDSWPKLKKDSSLAMVSLSPHLPIFKPSPGAEVPEACEIKKIKSKMKRAEALSKYLTRRVSS